MTHMRITRSINETIGDDLPQRVRDIVQGEVPSKGLQ